jgi:hypothetical protein
MTNPNKPHSHESGETEPNSADSTRADLKDVLAGEETEENSQLSPKDTKYIISTLKSRLNCLKIRKNSKGLVGRMLKMLFVQVLESCANFLCAKAAAAIPS